ncbi:MAG: GreA/GreB family elongation factor [Candidatus Nitrospinota bacterium M3_3B_026]
MRFEIVNKLEQELSRLTHELRHEIPRELETAAAHGDLSENAEYDAAKERKSLVESRIAHLTKRVREILAINLRSIPQDRVGFGSRVVLEDMETGETVTYTFVFPEEVDPDNGRISLATPIGKALMGKEEGDEVTVSAPSGARRYEITDLQTIHDQAQGSA